MKIIDEEGYLNKRVDVLLFVVGAVLVFYDYFLPNYANDFLSLIGWVLCLISVCTAKCRLLKIPIFNLSKWKKIRKMYDEKNKM